MATPESKAKNRLKTLLKKYECYYVTTATGGFGKSGTPDVTGCHKGRYFGVEVKADTKVTALQQLNLDQIRAAGGAAFVVRQSTTGIIEGFDEFESWLKSI